MAASPSTTNTHFTRSKLADFKAAGVLPLALHAGRAHVLLGAELVKTGPGGKVWKHMWSDFGGGREAMDVDEAATAGREFAEETLGLFGGCGVNSAAVAASAEHMARQLRTNEHCLRVVHQLKRGKYIMFIALLPYIDPLLFQLAVEQNSSRRAVAGAEKDDFVWLPLQELLHTVSHPQPRYFYSSSQRVYAERRGSMCRKKLQLHPCFASSLRIAQACGLPELLEAVALPTLQLPPPPPQLVFAADTDELLASDVLHTDQDNARPSKIARVELRPEHMLYWVAYSVHGVVHDGNADKPTSQSQILESAVAAG